jgi:hypothetical protein
MTSLVFTDGSNVSTNVITGNFSHRAYSFAVEVTINSDYAALHGDSMRLTIDNTSSPGILTFQSYNLEISEILKGTHPTGRIIVSKLIPDLSAMVTGLDASHINQLQQFSNSSTNAGSITYNFSTIFPVTAKLYITLAGVKYTAICPSFLYVVSKPTLADFSITQSPDSSALNITNLLVEACNSYKYFPSKLEILADARETGVNLNTDSEVVLGEFFVDYDNKYDAANSTMTALNSALVSLADDAAVPITQSSYKIDMTNSSEGLLQINTNRDLLVYSAGTPKLDVELPLDSQAINVLYLRAPVYIGSVVSYDAVNNYGAVDSPTMKIMTVTLNTNWTGYEPDTVEFTLTTSTNNLAPSAVWTFTTSTPLSYSASGVYNINLDQMMYIGSSDSSDTASHKLDNNPSSYKLKVTADWDDISVYRESVWGGIVVFTQDLPPVVTVSAHNTWHLVSGFNSENIHPNDTVMPSLGITLNILKNDLFNGITSNSLDDPSKTNLRIQYKRQSGSDASWTNVPSGYAIQPNGDVTGNALLTLGATTSLNSYSPSGSGNNLSDGLVNIPAVNGASNLNKIGSLQNPVFVYLPNIGAIYNESASDPLLFQVRVETLVFGYNTAFSEYRSINTPHYSIKKPLEYSWSAGSALEPYMNFATTPDNLVLPMLVGSNDDNAVQSIYYSKGYVSFLQNSAAALAFPFPAVGDNPEFQVTLGENVKYTVTYEYTNPNLPSSVFMSKISSSYSAPCQGLPVRSDYSVVNTSIDSIYNYTTGNLVFDFSMVSAAVSGPPNVTRIDGVDVRIKDANGVFVNGGSAVKVFYNYSGAGITKCVPGSQSISLDNGSGSSNSLGLTRGAFYTLEFAPFRDSLVITTGEHSYPAYSEWYTTPEFKYLNRPDVPVIYSWGTLAGGREPYMNYEANAIIIPMYVKQTVNYDSATITWLQNINLGIVYSVNTPVSVTTSAEFPSFPVTYGTALIYQVTYNYLGASGTTSPGTTSGVYTANWQNLPVSTDFTVSNNLVNYVYDNSLDRLVFNLSMVAPAASSGPPNTTRIDGVDLFIPGVNGDNAVATFYNYGPNMYTPGAQAVNLSGLSGLMRGNQYNMVFKAFRDDNVQSTGDKTYSLEGQWYQPPLFTYLQTNVRDTPVLYSWGANNIAAQPYMNFLANMIVIPMDINQSPNYAGAIVNWYKNDLIGIDVDNNQGQVSVPYGPFSQYEVAPNISVQYGTVVIYTVTYVYLSLDGVTLINGVESSRRSASCQGMPITGDFTQYPAYDSNGYPVYIQNNVDNSLSFMLNTVNTSSPSLLTHRIDGVVLYILNNNNQQQYVARFNNYLINSNSGQCIVSNFTAEQYNLTPGNTYPLTFVAYRDRRVSDTDAVFGSDNFIVSDNVMSNVNFVFLKTPMATVYDDQNAGTANVISVSNVVSSNYPADNVGGAKDQFTISWPSSKINDVTKYLIYKVTLATPGTPESRVLEYTQNANAYPYGGMYTYSKDIPDVSQKITYDIQKSYNGRLSADTRISFPVSSLKTKPATITIVKQDIANIYAQCEQAAMDLISEAVLLDIMVRANHGAGDSALFPFKLNGGKINPNGKENVLTIPQLFSLGKQLILQQEFRVEWSLTVNGVITSNNLDTFYGPPASFVYASRPNVSLKDENNINSNRVAYLGRPALKLKLDAAMGIGAPGFITPSLTSVITILAQDTSTIVQNIQTAGVDNILVFSAAIGQTLQQNSVYTATGDYSNTALPLSLAMANNSSTTSFQLYTGDLTSNDLSYLVFPSDNGGYVPGAEVNMMILGGNSYGIDSYAKSFFF